MKAAVCTRYGSPEVLQIQDVATPVPTDDEVLIRRVLAPKGICVMVGAPSKLGTILTRILHAIVLSRFVSQAFVFFMARRSKEDLVTLHDLMAAGKVTPVIDRCYPLNEVSAALRHLADGHARGKVVIAIG